MRSNIECFRGLEITLGLAHANPRKVLSGRYMKGMLAQLEPFEADGLIALNNNGFTVTETGRLFVRNLAMCFDAYLAAEQAQRYSRTV